MGPRWQKLLKEYGEAFLIALILALFIRTFVVEAFKIPSGSMLSTVLIGDHLLVNKFTYGVKIPFTDKTLIHLNDPQHGDIVVFKYPMDPSVDYIKRVIGVPGDRIRIDRKQVWRNGELLSEPYVQHTDPFVYQYTCQPPPLEPSERDLHLRSNHCRDSIDEFTVPQGKYFMMGDNRDASADSRFWGFVDRSAIRGKALVIYWSWNGLTNIRWGRIGTLVR